MYVHFVGLILLLCAVDMKSSVQIQGDSIKMLNHTTFHHWKKMIAKHSTNPFQGALNNSLSNSLKSITRTNNSTAATTTVQPPSVESSSRPSSLASVTTTPPTLNDSSTRSPRNCMDVNTVCLDGSDSDYKGNVLVGGLPVCDDSWSLASATVVCRELGFYKATKWFIGSRFGNDTRNFIMDNVKCLGTETRLVDCPNNSQNDCGPSEVAGVECDTRNYTDIIKSDCFELDVIYSNTQTTINSTESADQCQLKCKNSTECQHFSFYPELKRCDLKNGNSKEFKHGAISGPKSCSNITAEGGGSTGPQNCFETGIGYNYGSYLDYGYTDDENLCQQRCQAYAGCRFFSYYQSSNECFMKTGNETKRSHNDVTSGPKYCPNDKNATAAANSRYAECYEPGTVCLLGGLKENEGNVHIGGKPVCDDSWDLKDGLVVCKELGYHAIVKITKESTYGKVNPDFAMDNVMCLGNEYSIKNCTFSSDDDCGASEGAGVMCDTRSKQEIDDELRLIQICFDEGVSYNFGGYIDFEVSLSPLACQKHCQNHPDCSHFTFYPERGRCYRKMGNEKRSTEGAISGPRNCSDPTYTAPPPGPTTPSTCGSPGAICLQGGTNTSEGNILIENRPICDDDWNLINAHIACKQLGFIGAMSFTKESKFGLTSANFRMDNVQCDGTEEKLVDCQYQRNHDCSEGEAAGVVCDTRSKDVEEIQELSCFEPGVSYSPGDWIDYDIVLSAYDCQVNCLAHPECMHFSFYRDTQKCYRKTTNISFPSAAAISGPRKCATNVTTPDGNNTASNNYSGPTTTTERNCDVPGVVCLKRGSSPNEGNVYIGGKPVCDDSWDTRDARVVCHELGYVDVMITYIESHFGAVGETFAMDNVECTGKETSLGVCVHKSTDDCGPAEAAGVLCDNGTQIEIPTDCKVEGKLCLIGGENDYEGNVYYGGKPVCDDGWSFADAHVVCVALGYAEAVHAKKESTYGIVPSRYGSTGVQCEGAEKKFHECKMTTEEINCNRMEGAGVQCREERRIPVGNSDSSNSAGNIVATMFVLATMMVISGILWQYRVQVRHVISREVMVRLSGSGPLLS